MTDKINLTSAGSGYNLTVINDNFTKIETALNDRVLYRDVQAGEANSLLSDLDANGKRIYNLPIPIDLNEAARLQDVQDAVSGATSANLISADDGASGTIFTTVQGFITKILSNIGSSLVGFLQAGTGAVMRSTQAKLRETISVMDFGAVGDGVADDTAFVTAADAAALAAGYPLTFTAGTYLVTSSLTFSAPVVMLPGSKIKVSSPSAYLKFSGGFEAPLSYVLDTDAPTQFLKTERIIPQWFGATGLNTDDQSVALTRAFRAVRAGAAASTSHPGAEYGARTVFFPSGVYRGNDIPVYCGTIVEGEWQGSLIGSTLTQIDHTVPLLRIVPKNYGLTDTILNDSNGQNYFRRIGFRSEVAASASEGAPICYFMSPQEATTYFGIPGDGIGGNNGHIDTMFSECWFKDGNTCIMCDEGTLWVHLRDCTFDVIRRAVQHKGTARGRINSYNNIYYGATWGAFDNQSSDTTVGVSWESHCDEFKAGNTSHGTADYRYAINYHPTTTVAGTSVRINGSHFRRTDGLGTRHGGAIRLSNVEIADLNMWMIDPDSTNDFKAVAIQGGVKYLRINGQIISNSIASYVNSRLIQISQSPQTLVSAKFDVEMINTNASSFATGLHSNFAVTEIDLERVRFYGNFTTVIDPLITEKTVTVPTVASAATINLTAGSRIFSISGTTGITAITTTGWAGKTVTLVFQGALTVTDGSNLKLNGNFVTTADDSLTLTCDGTNWFEVGRSPN